MNVNISWHIIWTIMLWHFFADFVFQKESWKLNKSSSNASLALHCLTYGVVMFIMISFFSPLWVIFNTVAHFVVDWITSRITKHFWELKDYNSFFIIIGLDQFIHLFIMFGSYIILRHVGLVYSAEQCIDYLGL